MNKAVIIATAPNYRPSGRGGGQYDIQSQGMRTDPDDTMRTRNAAIGGRGGGI